MMGRRVERVSPVSRVAFDVARSFEDRRGFADHGGGQPFKKALGKAMRKARQSAAPAETDTAAQPADAYTVNVTRAAQSLFYANETLPQRIGNPAHE